MEPSISDIDESSISIQSNVIKQYQVLPSIGDSEQMQTITDRTRNNISVTINESDEQYKLGLEMGRKKVMEEMERKARMTREITQSNLDMEKSRASSELKAQQKMYGIKEPVKMPKVHHASQNKLRKLKTINMEIDSERQREMER